MTSPRPAGNGGLTISSGTLIVIGFVLTGVQSYTLLQRDDTRHLREQIQGNSVTIARLEGRLSALERDIDRLRPDRPPH